MVSFEFIVSIILIFILGLLFKIFNSVATCPITGKKDFKKNMYSYHFCDPRTEFSFVAYYSKEGYEKRFDCKIVKAKIQKKNWTTISNKKKN